MPRIFSDPRLFSLICVVLGGMGQGVVAPKLPDLLKNSSTLAFDSGLSAALMYLGIFVSTFRFGKLADRGKFHWLLGPGLFFYAVSLVGLGFAHSTVSVMILRFFEGLTLSAIFVAADFALGRLSPESSRGRWLSYYGVALSVGLLLGPALSLGLQRLCPSPLLPLACVAVLALVLGIMAGAYRIPRLAATHRKQGFTLERGALTSGMAYGYMEAALVAVLPILAVQEFKVPPELLLIVIIIAGAVSSLIWGIAADRFGPRRIVHLLMGALFLGTFLLSGIDADWIVAGVFFGIIAGGLYPVGFSWLLQSLPKSQYGHASGSFARAYGLGSLAGPLISGKATQALGSRGLYSSICVFSFLAFAFVLSRPRPQD